LLGDLGGLTHRNKLGGGGALFIPKQRRISS
jgi:hypothetical protein